MKRMRIVYALNLLDEWRYAKGVFHNQPLLRGNDIVYDMTGKGKPLWLPLSVVRSFEKADELPFTYNHNPKHVLGHLEEVYWDWRTGFIRGDIVIDKEHEAFVREALQRGVNGISSELLVKEERQPHLNIAKHIRLLGASLVANPACHHCRMEVEE